MPPLTGILSSCWSVVATDSANSNREQDILLWHEDLRRHATGDFSIAVVQANAQLEDQSQVKTGPHGTQIGVYDGHGGPEASRFIRKHIFSKIESFAREQGCMSTEVLKKAFNATEEEFLGLVDKKWRSMPNFAAVGSCCLVGVICGNMLYIANLGDSRAVLGTLKAKRRVHAVRLSIEHNAGNVEEREELKAQHPDDSHIVVQNQGVWRVKGIIQVTRSIGDVYLKKPELNRDPHYALIGYPLPLKKPVLTAEPSLLEHTLGPQDRFLIFASDGLWDLMNEQQAVNIVHSNPRMGIARRLVQVALQAAARKWQVPYSDLKKIEQGYRRNFHDDISVVVIFLDHERNNMNKHNSPRTRVTVDIVTPPMNIIASERLENNLSFE